MTENYNQRKESRIIDADEAIGECDMNYDHELVSHQSENLETCERVYSGTSEYSTYRRNAESPVELERRAKSSLKKRLDKLP